MPGQDGARQTLTPRHQFTGEEPDPASGYYRFGARAYDPTLRRWLSPDPFVLVRPERTVSASNNLNLYGYAANNPISAVDRSGRWPDWVEDIVDEVTGGAEETGEGAAQAAGAISDADLEEFAAGAAAVGGGSVRVVAGTSEGVVAADAAGGMTMARAGAAVFFIFLSTSVQHDHPHKYTWANENAGNPDDTSTRPASSESESADDTSAEEPTTVEELLEHAQPGRATKGRTKQWVRPGGVEEANRDFDRLRPQGVRELKEGGRTGTLGDGRRATVRPASGEGSPTLEIQDGKKKVKIRYRND